MVVTIVEDAFVGRGECVPYPRYGESLDLVQATIADLTADVAHGLDRTTLAGRLDAGAARNALDCALWDLEAKRRGQRVWELAGLDAPRALTTAYTISLDTPEAMAAAARAHASRPLLKLKLDGTVDIDRVRCVRDAAPASELIVDANEAWPTGHCAEWLHELARLDVRLVEQPLPAEADEVLRTIERPLPVCADESCHTSDDVAALADRYDYVNVKLDKAGGLTEALRVAEAARRHGLGLMVGCMVGTSLGIAPATLVAQTATFADLDAPLWLQRDRDGGLRFDGSVVWPPPPDSWG